MAAKKRSKGRPELPPDEKRDYRLVVKLNESEREQVQADARNAGLPVAIYARWLLTRKTTAPSQQ